MDVADGDWLVEDYRWYCPRFSIGFRNNNLSAVQGNDLPPGAVNPQIALIFATWWEKKDQISLIIKLARHIFLSPTENLKSTVWAVLHYQMPSLKFIIQDLCPNPTPPEGPSRAHPSILLLSFETHHHFPFVHLLQPIPGESGRSINRYPFATNHYPTSSNNSFISNFNSLSLRTVGEK